MKSLKPLKMIFSFPKVNKTVEVLNDLVKINNDRITLYKKALEGSCNIDSYLHETLTDVIADAISFRQQLAQKIKQLYGDVNNTSTLFGKIYAAWMDLKVAFVCNTQKTIIASYLYNEEVALHVYNAALSASSKLSADMHQLIEKQKMTLKDNYDTIKGYREVSRSIDYSLLHF